MENEIDKIIQNPDKSATIRQSHLIRLELLNAIHRADVKEVEKINTTLSPYIEGDKIDLFKRVEGNELRSFKNFMLSHNSLYALYAELGGLDPVLSHYMSEKYAIIIESTKSKQKLFRLHNAFLLDYSSPSNRISLDNKEFLSKKVDYFISVHFMNPISIPDLAEKLFVTREHLMRTYKKETGQTIQEKIKQTRLVEARHLLKQTSLNVTTIALMVGFNSSQYFSKVFKDEEGISPTEYREKTS